MPGPEDQCRAADAIHNPFEETTPHMNEYTAQEIATLQSRLDRQLGPEYISTRTGAGGNKVHYLAAEKVINLANEVFGFNGWSSAIQNVQIDFVDESQSSGKISLGLSVICRVTLRDGTFHEDIGYGCIENCKGKAAAFEKAKKEAATDALKRALRNFGNVLGNCLYDKDYLSRITKIKPAPSKWDADNLHRHHDYMPVKKDPVATATTTTVPEGDDKALRLVSEQSSVTNGTDFEDEFGGNLFDEMDLTRPDEVVLDNTSVMEGDISEVRGKDKSASAATPLQARQSMSRVQSMPALRPPNGGPPPQVALQQRPPFQQRAPQTPNGNQNTQGRMLPPQQESNQPSRPQQPVHPIAPQHPPLQNPPPQQRNVRSNPSSASESSADNKPSSAPDDGPQHDGTGNGNDPPVGFVTSRAAELLQKSDNANPVLPPNVPAFNPHAESPSIRRTSGINHNTSAPVNRQVVAGTNGQPNGTNGGNVGPVPNKTNFVNPQADANRRIGMPGTAQSPLANRGAYKPPGPAMGKRGPEANARPPLADLSNVQMDGGRDEVDAKKVKVAGT